MRQVKKGSEFRPVVNTGGWEDKDLLSAVVINQATGSECGDYTVGDFTQLLKVDNDNNGKTDGSASVGSKTITLKSGNTLKKGDLFLSNGVGYRVVSASDTSVTIDKELEAEIADDVQLDSSNKLTTYDAPCTINEIGLFDIVISHPEMNDTVLKYETVEITTNERIESLRNDTRKMVASA